MLMMRLLLIIILILQYRLWLGKHSISQLITTTHEINIQKNINKIALEKNNSLKLKITEFKNDEYAIENYARRELGMIREGEIFYYMPSAPSNNNNKN